MKRELLTVEFRYLDAPQGGTQYKHKTIAIGIIETLEEAVKKGNEVIQELSKHFKVCKNDHFSLNGFLGCPVRLVSNCCSTDSVEYYAKITSLDFADMATSIQNAFEATSRYLKYKKEMEE